ncbi:MAG TPA: metallophosphoesterase [Clostridiales bacterium]|nr:metallophosphoesterase [Clostridiales bacterium]
MLKPTLLLLIAMVLLWLYWGNTTIKTTKISVAGKALPSSFTGFVIAHISDLHNAEFGSNQKNLLKAITAASPDLIAVTGDLIDSRRTDIKKALTFIEGAAKIAPVYYVTGNHESRITAYSQFEAALLDHGTVILRNAEATVKRGDDRIRLWGLDDPTFNEEHGRIKNRFIAEKALRSLAKEEDLYTVLLSHRPELFNLYVECGIDLALCGHAHGGQVRLPLLGGLYAPNQGRFPTYQNGLYQKGPTKMVVSRGLGNSLDPLRINNRPELIVITLEAK